MRLRNVPGSREILEADRYVIGQEEQQKALAGHWRELFGNDHPVYIEVGMGKGRFIMEHAANHPEINYIGIEKFSNVLVRAVQKRSSYEGDNVYFLRMDAENLCDVFGEGECSRIYLNFSDPWPKARHDKRRLTHHRFLQIYSDLLPAGGLIEFKTDNMDLFDFSIEEIEAFPDFDLIKITRDLHLDDDMNPGNVMTEYEAKFSAQGNPIYKLIAARK